MHPQTWTDERYQGSVAAVICTLLPQQVTRAEMQYMPMNSKY